MSPENRTGVKVDQTPTTTKYRYEVSSDGTERLIIQADHLAELEAAIKKSREVVLFQAKPEVKPAPATVESPNKEEKLIPLCGIHHTPMTWRSGISQKTGKPYGFWTCTQRLDSGEFCPYKPQKGAV